MSSPQLVVIDFRNFLSRVIGWDKSIRSQQGAVQYPIEDLFNRMYASLQKRCTASSVFVWCNDKKIVTDEFPEGKYWRHDIYAKYKAQRKAPTDDYPYVEVKKKITDIIDADERSVMITVPGIEADDIAYVVLNEYENPSKNLAVTTDRDWYQLLSLGLTDRIFDKAKTIRTYSPAELFLKIQKGDTSDNIPKAKNNDDRDRNEILMDFTKIPESIIEQIKQCESFKKIAEKCGTDDGVSIFTI